MFNKKSKQIKNLKENIKEVNNQKMQLRNENIIYQKELNALKEMVANFTEAIKFNNDILEKMIIFLIENNRPTTKTKKVVKKDAK